MTRRLSDIRSCFVLAAASMALALGFAGSAYAIPLSGGEQALTIGNSLTIGDFTYELTNCSISGGSCSGALTGYFDQFVGHPGVLVIAGPSGGNLLSSLGPPGIDLTVEFRVTTAGTPFTVFGLGMNAAVSGSGVASVDESVGTDPTTYNPLLDGDFITDSVHTLLTSSVTDLSDQTSAPYNSTGSVFLDKDIFLNGPGEIRYVTQRLSRVPEPSGLGLLLVAGAALFLLRRRDTVNALRKSDAR